MTRVDTARFVADHWRGYFLGLDPHDPARVGAHALCMVIAALDGETDPQMCGIEPESYGAFLATLEVET